MKMNRFELTALRGTPEVDWKSSGTCHGSMMTHVSSSINHACVVF